ncbi:MAG: hypothetical protein AAF412_03645 [Pseudomonadota bacterium]
MLSKKDANQDEIFDILRHAQLVCYDLHKAGQSMPGFPDALVVGYSLIEKCVMNVLVEIKSETGRLEPSQKEWHSKYRNTHGGGRLPLIVADDAQDILEWFGR